MLIAQADIAVDTIRRGAGVFPRDEPLSDDGRASASVYRPAMPRSAAAFAAPARAAVETATALGFNASVIDELRDLDVGAWAGRSLADIAATEPQAAAAFIANPEFAGHGGEAIAAFIARFDRWLAGIAERRETMIAVASPAVVRAVFVAAVRAPPSSLWHVDVAALATLKLSSDGRRWAVRELTPYRRASNAGSRDRPAISGR